MFHSFERHTSTARPPNRRSRLTLESLEDRCLLTATPTALPPQFGSADAFIQYVRDNAIAQYQSFFGAPAGYGNFYPIAFGGGAGIYYTAGGTVASATNVTFSTTNNQVVGVNEGDIVQTDGNYLYDLSHNQLVIFQTNGIAAPQIVTRLNIEGNPIGEFLDGDRVTVISSVYDSIKTPISLGSGLLPYVPQASKIKVTVFDVANRAAPTVEVATYLDGTYVNSRSVDGVVYVAVNNSFVGLPAPLVITGADGLKRYETQDAYLARVAGHEVELSLPHAYEQAVHGFTGSDPASNYASIGLLADPAQIYRPAGASDSNLLTITAFDSAASKPRPVGAASLLGVSASAVYATANHFYVVAPNWNGGGIYGGSTIDRFDLAGTTVTLGAVGHVAGSVAGQFSLDEQGQYLRVVTRSGWGENSTTSLFVLANNAGSLDVVGSLTNIAPGESLQSVRFLGSKAFLVTVKAIDPLFAVDLSDPTAPSLVGELHIPGFSTYLQMIDDTHLIGVGRDGFGVSSLKIALFDVSDLANPREVDHYIVSGSEFNFSSSTGSEAEWDHHALSYFPETRTLAIPVTSRDVVFAGGLQVINDFRIGNLFQQPPYKSSLWIFSVDPAAGFTLQGTIDHDSTVRRSLRIGDQLYSIADDSVQVHPLNNPTAPAVDVRIVDNPRDVVSSPVAATVNVPFTAILQTFDVTSAVGLTAVIDWGDGFTSAGDIVGVIGSTGRFTVGGTHTYKAPGNFFIQIVLQRPGVNPTYLSTPIAVAPEIVAPSDAGNLAFLVRLYANVLSRQIDSVGQTYWLMQIHAGVPRDQIAKAIAQSPESLGIIVNQTFVAALQRTPDANDVKYWSAFLANNHTSADLRAQLINTVEFGINSGSTPEAVVRSLYQRVLNRDADALDAAYWTARSKAGASLGDIAAAIFQSDEAARVAVQSAYTNLLSRRADPLGLSAFSNSLLKGRPIEDINLAIFASDEYFKRQ